jgi:predicted ester cyclase
MSVPNAAVELNEHEKYLQEAEEAFELGFRRVAEHAAASGAEWAARSDELLEFGCRWALDGYVKRDVDALVSMVTDDFTNEDPMNLGRVVRGPVGYRKMMEETFRAFPDTQFFSDGDVFLGLDEGRVIIPWRTTGTFLGPLAWGPPGSGRTLAPTGRRFDFAGIDKYLLRGGKVATMRSYYDPIEVARQIGLLPDPAGPLLTRVVTGPQALAAQIMRRWTR